MGLDGLGGLDFLLVFNRILSVFVGLDTVCFDIMVAFQPFLNNFSLDSKSGSESESEAAVKASRVS